MTIRTQKLLLRLSSMGLVTAAIGVGARAWLEEPATEVPPMERPSVSPEPSDTTTASSSQRSPEDPLWKKRLRRPLYDPPPPPPPQVVEKPLPPLQGKLLGTIIEPGASQAMVSVPGKGVSFRKVGEKLSEVDQDTLVTEILPSSIKIQRRDQVTTLTIENAN